MSYTLSSCSGKLIVGEAIGNVVVVCGSAAPFPVDKPVVGLNDIGERDVVVGLKVIRIVGDSVAAGAGVGLRDGAANGVDVDGATVRPGKTNKVGVDVSNGTVVTGLGEGQGDGGRGLGRDEGLGEGPGVGRDVCGTGMGVRSS